MYVPKYPIRRFSAPELARSGMPCNSLSVPTWIIGPTFREGPLIERPADVLKVWPTPTAAHPQDLEPSTPLTIKEPSLVLFSTLLKVSIMLDYAETTL